MGQLLRTFTYPRNAFAATAEQSAQKALDLLDRVGAKKLLESSPGQIKDENFNDSRVFLGIVAGPPTDPVTTTVGASFRKLADQSPVGAWRWLLTRSMWLYSVPNGSNVQVNKTAHDLGIRFNYFDMVARLLVHMSALPAPDNILYFDELLAVLDDDANWTLQADELFQLILSSRLKHGLIEPGDHRELLSDLEPAYSISRDYLSTVFRKAFGQSGLFTITTIDHRVLGIKLDPSTYENPVMAERLRFALDNPRIFGGHQ